MLNVEREGGGLGDISPDLSPTQAISVLLSVRKRPPYGLASLSFPQTAVPYPRQSTRVLGMQKDMMSERERED